MCNVTCTALYTTAAAATTTTTTATTTTTTTTMDLYSQLLLIHGNYFTE
jgi:hypothetical protein